MVEVEAAGGEAASSAVVPPAVHRVMAAVFPVVEENSTAADLRTIIDNCESGADRVQLLNSKSGGLSAGPAFAYL